MLFTEWKLEEAQQVWLEEGREEGREEERLKNEEWLLGVARTMFAEGDSIEKIARVTKEPLERLKEKLRVQ